MLCLRPTLFALPLLAPLAALSATALSATSAHAQAPTLSISSATHGDALARDFSDGKPGFSPFAPPGGVPSGAVLSIVNGALKVVNTHPGSFGLSANMAAFDALKYSHIAFDYKLAPEVKVNIFLRVKGKYHGATFSGPDRVRPGSVKLGRIANIKADREWHRAILPLRTWLQKIYPTEESLTVDEIIVGNWDNTGYLVAGFGGNPSGATYWLDNWSLVGARSAEKTARFQINAPLSAPLQYSLDFDAPKSLASKTLELSPSDGFHILNVSQKSGAKVIARASFPFWMSGGSPGAGAPRLSGQVLEVPINSSAPLDVRASRATIAGQVFQAGAADSSAVSPLQIEPSAEGAVLKLAVGASGMKWSNGQAIPIELNLRDSLGREVKGGKSEFKVDFGKLEGTPPSPRIKLERSGLSWELDGTFERNAGGWVGAGSDGAIVDRDTSTKASGDYSLRFTCPASAAAFKAELRREAIDVEQFPIVSFDYKATPDLRLDFFVSSGGQMYRVSWMDKGGDRYASEIGAVPDVRPDGKWHHAEFNLAAMLRAARPGASAIKVDLFLVGDSGWLGNARGAQFWLDNFRFVPIEKAPLSAQVLVDDVSGVQAVAFSVDAQPETAVDVSKKVAGDRVVGVGGGRKYLHLRAQNGAGQWSPAAHFPLWLDSAAPRIESQLPADGQEAAPTRQSWIIADETGLDSRAVSLDVGGQKFSLDDASLSFDRSSRTLAWSPLRAIAASKFTPLEDGAKVNWKLDKLADLAGNVESGRVGSWTYKKDKDKEPPAVDISSTTHGALQHDSFENGLDGVRMWEVRESARVERVASAEPGGHALRVSATAANGAMWVAARVGEWDANKFPVASFRYRLAPELKNLSIRLAITSETVWHVRIKGEANNPIARMRGTGPEPRNEVLADGQWHWGSINLLEALKRDGSGKTDASKVQGLDFLDPMRANPANAWYEIDDFTLSNPGGGEVKLNWAALDVGGVESTRVAWDNNPETIPTEVTAETSRTIKAEPGAYFLHVQSRDKAGNASATTHFPVVVR